MKLDFEPKEYNNFVSVPIVVLGKQVLKERSLTDRMKYHWRLKWVVQADLSYQAPSVSGKDKIGHNKIEKIEEKEIKLRPNMLDQNHLQE